MKRVVMDGGYIKLYRSIDSWEYRQDPNVFSVWIRLLTMANYESKQWNGIIIERGQCVTSVNVLVKECGLTTQNVRTALKKLEKSGNLTRKTTNKYTIVTICKYEDYQSGDNITQQTSQQTTNKQLTTTKNIKKERSIEEVILKDNMVIFSDLPDESVNPQNETQNNSLIEFSEIKSYIDNSDISYMEFTFSQYKKLKNTLSYERIVDVITQIENCNTWHTYKSLYAAIEQYLKYNKNEGDNSRINSK